MDTNIKKPKVSVVMSVYNTEKYVSQAIQSILDQSFTDFELVIINDGSTDKSLEIIKSFKDDRIVLINNKEKTYTITGARNELLRQSRGEYIAPLDSDDIATKNRLELEVHFLDSHRDYAMVGGNVEVIDSKGEKTGVAWREIIPDEKIPVRLLFNNCFSQSSLMIREEAIPEQGYIESTSEDFHLWIRILKNWKANIIHKTLLYYRTHVENTTTIKADLLYKTVNEILTSQLKEIGIEPTEKDLAIHRANYRFKGEKDELESFISKREEWLLKLSNANQKTNRYNTKIFNEVMAERFLTTLESNSKLGFYSWKTFFKSPLSKNLNWKEEWLKVIKLFIKCILRK